MFITFTRTGNLSKARQPRKYAYSGVRSGGYIWLDYNQPQKEDLTLLIEPLGLHPLSIEDSCDQHQIPKIDDYSRNTFILFNAFHYSKGILAVTEVDAFLGRNYLVTVSSHNSHNLSLLENIQRSIASESESARHGPAFLLHIILDQVVDEKFVAIEALEEKLNEGEEVILSSLERFDPSDLMHLRRDLLTVRKSLFHEREILVKICRKDSPFIPDEAIYLYRDIYDHLSKFFELTESYRDLVTSLMEMYLSMLNNKMTKAANDTNITVRRLTLIYNHLHATYFTGRDRRDVGMVNDDWGAKLANCLPGFPGGDGGIGGNELLYHQMD